MTTEHQDIREIQMLEVPATPEGMLLALARAMAAGNKIRAWYVADAGTQHAIWLALLSASDYAVTGPSSAGLGTFFFGRPVYFDSWLPPGKLYAVLSETWSTAEVERRP